MAKASSRNAAVTPRTAVLWTSYVNAVEGPDLRWHDGSLLLHAVVAMLLRPHGLQPGLHLSRLPERWPPVPSQEATPGLQSHLPLVRLETQPAGRERLCGVGARRSAAGRAELVESLDKAHILGHIFGPIALFDALRA